MPPANKIIFDNKMDGIPLNGCRRNSTGPKYHCSQSDCGASFMRMDQLDRHEYHHTGIMKHGCHYENCLKKYSILTHLKRHIRTVHEQTEPLKKAVQCEVPDCDKLFTSTSNMQRHIREVHENPKVYKCQHCGEKFTQKLKMRRHEINKHTGEFPYKCSKCSKGFYQQWQYESHIPVCKVYPCTNCSEQFDKWTSYVKHCKETKHGRKYHTCEHCERIYAKPSELRRHIAAKHTAEDQKMYFMCTHGNCGRSYAYERNLRQHMQTVHIGKRFKCEQIDCQRDFSSSQNLLKHVERDHLNLKDKNVSKHMRSTKTTRKKRKDAGTSKISALTKLSELIVDKELDNLLSKREATALVSVSNQLTELTDRALVECDHLKTILEPTKETQIQSLLSLTLQDI